MGKSKGDAWILVCYPLSTETGDVYSLGRKLLESGRRFLSCINNSILFDCCSQPRILHFNNKHKILQLFNITFYFLVNL